MAAMADPIDEEMTVQPCRSAGLRRFGANSFHDAMAKSPTAAGWSLVAGRWLIRAS
jgi:hypothetical protein